MFIFLYIINVSKHFVKAYIDVQVIKIELFLKQEENFLFNVRINM